MRNKLLPIYFFLTLFIGCSYLVKAQQRDTLIYNPKKGVGLSMNSDTSSPYYYLPKVEELNLSWYYHYGYTYPTGLPDSIEWVPMIASYYGNQAKLDSQIAYIDSLKALGKVHHLLGYNEPFNNGMTWSGIINGWPSLMSVGVPLGSPAFATRDSLAKFMDSVKTHNFRVDFICVHWYAQPNVGAFLNFLRGIDSAYHKPIWVTEFGVADFDITQVSSQNQYSQDSVLTFMKEVIPTLDGWSWIQRYAWHASEHPKYWTSYLWVDSTDTLSDPEGIYYAQHQYNKMDPTDYVGPIQINAQGNLEIFGEGDSSHIYRKYQLSNNSIHTEYPNSQEKYWSKWFEIPNMTTSDSDIAVGRNLDKTIEVFVSGGAGTNGDVFFTRQTGPNKSYSNSDWMSWTDIGGSGYTSLQVTNNKDGSLNLFGLDNVGNVYHTSETSPNSNTWTGWSQITGDTLRAGFAVTPDTDGQIILAGDKRDASHDFVVTWQQSGDTWNGGWKDLGNGGTNTRERVRFARNADGRLAMFVRGNSGEVDYASQEKNEPDTVWSSWQGLGKSLRNDFVVSRALDGRLVVIGIDQSSPHGIYNLWQATPGGGWDTSSSAWGYKPIGLPSNNITFNIGLMVGLTVDGRMQFFAKGSDGNVWSDWWLYEDTVQNGISYYKWSSWTTENNFGGPNIIWKIGNGNKNKLSSNTKLGKFQLIGNYPNPFNPTTTIQYHIPKTSFVTLTVYDVLGDKIANLVYARETPGIYNVIFDGSKFSSGVYFYRLQAGDYSAVKKLLLLK